MNILAAGLLLLFYTLTIFRCLIKYTEGRISVPDRRPDKETRTDNATRRYATGPGTCGIQAFPRNSTILGRYQKVFKAVVGGAESHKNGWPWLLRLSGGGDSDCGASLVRVADHIEESDIVITAAHCSNRDTIRAGDFDKNRYEDTEQISYKKNAKNANEYHKKDPYDLAVIHLTKPIKFNDAARPICLPSHHQKLYAGQQCVTTGWGRINYHPAVETTTPHEAVVPLISSRRCVRNHRIMGSRIYPRLELCAGTSNKDACLGDSGGPLMCQLEGKEEWVLTGVVSWGERCAYPGLWGVYARVSYFIPFIRRAICEMSRYKNETNFCQK